MKHLKLAILCLIAATLNLTAMQAQNTGSTNNTAEQMAVIHTPYGDITIKLYNETPQHRDNFIKLVKAQIFDGTLFHRVIKNFMIQGGDPQSKNAKPGEMLGSGDLGYTVPAEFIPGLIHKKGALSAARLGDNVNPAKESSASQFYLVQGRVYTPQEIDMLRARGIKISPENAEIYTTMGGTPFLDGEYTVFGEVVEGLDIIDKIAEQATDPNDRPLEDIRMTITLK